ncbi:hypothetical protein GE061_010358 [Apolygus lucorum]|uniref:Uncharacterized protein n=1 Tax=Apolygus lucorum TaxID=248454 RepID=A0A8S9Y2S7_APOLU|nr:hypothetical protein GE061_010358 [Apolygus lucorum]
MEISSLNQRRRQPANPNPTQSQFHCQTLRKQFEEWTPSGRSGMTILSSELDSSVKVYTRGRDRLDKIWMNQIEEFKKKSKTPSLPRAIAVTFKKEIIFITLIHLIVSLADVLLRPLLLGTLITSFSRDDPQETVVTAVELILVNLGTSLLSNHYLYQTVIFGMKMRAAVVSIVFRKSLRLSKTALNDVSPGQIVNLVSNDVSRFDIVAVAFSFLWSGPLQTVIVSYFLYRDVGIYSFAGMAVIVGVTIFQTYTARLTSQFRRKIARETDTRIRLTDEILAGILVLKLYAWEIPYTKLLEQARRAELKYVRRSNFIRTIYMAFNLSTTKWAMFLTLSTYILSGFKLTTAQVFVISSYYSILNHSISSVFVRGIQEVAECTVSMKRLQAFLMREEIDIVASSPVITVKEESTGEEPHEDTPLKQDESITTEEETEFNAGNNKPVNGGVHGNSPGKNGQSGGNSDLAIVVQDVKASWVEGRMVPTLMNLTFTVRRGNLIGLIGSVGSGKSSLLHLLLSELKQDVGKVFVNGSVSYASQESWIFAGTVRDNILLGRPYNRARFRKVVAASCLTRDLEMFPHGDRTMVGERGASLSGGQRARISLARAIYCEADIYLLDDPLSAVDAHVANEMFQNCFKGFLRNKTVILATHQLQFLDQVDKVIFLQMGQIKDTGSFEELMSRGHDFTKIVEESQVTTPAVQSSDVSSPVEKRMSRQISESEASVMGSTVSIRSVEGKDEESQPLQDTNAPYEGNIFVDYLKAGRATLTFSSFLFTLILAQFFCSLSDYWVSDWAKTFDVRKAGSIAGNSTFKIGGQVNDTVTLLKESLKGNNTQVNGTDALTNIMSNLTSININQTNPSNSTKIYGLMSLFGNEWTDEFYATVYGILTGLLFTLALLRGVLFVFSSLKCSEGLHSKMLKSALYTDLSFFNNNPSGSILNKFSKDLGVTDEMLPKAILDSSQTMGLVIGGIVNTLIVNYMLLLPLAVFILASILIRKFYMRTATNLKRIENMSRSPIYTHLNTSLQGLTTIRAQRAQNYLKMAFDFHQDLNTACLFTYCSAQQAYTYCLDICSIAFVSIVLFVCIVFRGGISGADLGLAVTQSMMMTGMLQWSTRQSSEVVNMMTSVERLVTFTKLPPEDPNEAEKKNPPSDWPSDGSIKLEKVSLRYKPDGPPALNDVDLIIQPGEKLGIVGRTGAGKSTLTSVLFRLAPVEGKCTIDNLETSTLNLQGLRASLAIIPQNPVLFSGNLRRNLDPFLTIPDHELWKALEDIDVSEIAKDGKGLDSRISDCGSNLSVGQRQLICLARAVLKNRNIIVLDEATASVDPETDAQIQKTIRKRFARCTVLTIAHRLNTIMDSDRILVMEAGRAVELDTPHNLLENKDGYFYSLVQETGPQMASRLTAQAKENHLRSLEEKKGNQASDSD